MNTKERERRDAQITKVRVITELCRNIQSGTLEQACQALLIIEEMYEGKVTFEIDLRKRVRLYHQEGVHLPKALKYMPSYREEVRRDGTALVVKNMLSARPRVGGIKEASVCFVGYVDQHPSRARVSGDS